MALYTMHKIHMVVYIRVSLAFCMVTKAKVAKRAKVPVSLPTVVVEKIERLRARLGYRSRNDEIRAVWRTWKLE